MRSGSKEFPITILLVHQGAKDKGEERSTMKNIGLAHEAFTDGQAGHEHFGGTRKVTGEFPVREV